MKFAFSLVAALFVFASTLAAAASPAHASTPQAFTAHYRVLKEGKPIGEAVMRLRADDGEWVYTTETHGKHGLAGLLGMQIDESSRFRIQNGHPEMLVYDYRLDAGIRKQHRHVQADWSQKKVKVRTDGHDYHYATVPTLVERHLLPLALGYALETDKHDIALPVAVKDRVETQHFRTLGKDHVTVPAGRVSTRKLQRSDAGKKFTAWYAPGKFATPVKLVHGKYTLLLESYSSDNHAASD